MKKTICVVTGSRAEYGILKPLLRAVQASNDMRLELVVTGTHLLKEFGSTQDEIVSDGFDIAQRIAVTMDTATNEGMISATAQTMDAFGRYFAQHKPDVVIILGDRFEIFAVAVAAAMHHLPIAHLHGGEITEGAIDEFLRHSITKMATLHFVACEQYRRRVIQLGEAPERVFNVGALGVENALHLPRLSLKALSESVGVSLAHKQFCVVTYHPVTMEDGTAEKQTYALIRAMEQFPQYHYIITKANADTGGCAINRIWKEQACLHPNFTVVTSLGAVRYFTALEHAKAVIGNSSSGILECPSMRLPTVNIGDRQKGRMMADSIICCGTDTPSIVRALEKAFSEQYAQIAAKGQSPFGGDDVSGKILMHLREFFKEGRPTGKKAFYDWRQ